MKRFIALLVLVVFAATGCVSAGTAHLGKYELPDGTVVDYHQVVSKGQGQEVLAVKGYRCDSAGKHCEKESEDTSAGDSAVYGLGKAAITGAAAGAFIGAGIGAGAAAARPSRVTQTGGGASATTGAVTQTASPTATANPVANAGSLTTGTVTGGSTVTGPTVGK